MKCNLNTLKRYSRAWKRDMNAAYETEFDRAAAVGYYRATPAENELTVLTGLLDRALSDDDRVYMAQDIDGKFTGEMVIRDIPALYEMGTDFGLCMVQNVLRGLNCLHREIVYTCICLDLNSATIHDFGKLIKILCDEIKSNAAEQAQTATEDAETETAPEATEAAEAQQGSTEDAETVTEAATAAQPSRDTCKVYGLTCYLDSTGHITHAITDDGRRVYPYRQAWERCQAVGGYYTRRPAGWTIDQSSTPAAIRQGVKRDTIRFY